MIKINSKSKIIRPSTALIILDGFGFGKKDDPGNAITSATAPNLFSYFKKYPHSTLKTYGQYAGLFPKQVGNSEAGHLNIGAGRIVKQDLVIISEAIHDGTFFKNTAFKQALYHAKKYNSAVHVMGMLTDGASAHSYPEHLYALLELFRREEQKKVYLHLFTDGRDSPPHAAAKYLVALRAKMQGAEKIATVMGRFYAMDRNKIWERIKLAHDALVGCVGNTAVSAEDAIAQAYNRGETDEYITPTVITEHGHPVTKVQDNDVIFFFNARSDRARQITKSFVQPDFNKKNPGSFTRCHVPKDIRFVAMTDFGPDLPNVLTAFPSEDIKNCLPAVIDGHYKQLYISETEKYAHVTYFINGGYPDALNGEQRELIHSDKIHSYAQKPQMHAPQLAQKISHYFKTGKYNFICVNFPNADMLGHTGNLAAAKKGIATMDVAVKKIINTLKEIHGQALIVADHGNAEVMINHKTKEKMNEHTFSPVPCILIGGKAKRLRNGILADVAPTLLKMMNIAKAKEMTGRPLY
ncbi:MAG: phosphoglycerate mutase (2,3-diphosphoglycerate-independent) [Candidatus Magasanikbacteria bacterium RIFOXYC2_FULL_42_28]|uniref:2,3-bisphosphoglycerate-independent phosphoglycerate mutase n=1 Tax=Candidatus Magasanikbacteria bacterium RIFOXYC2_FULL_42_28 TaxID=1798704 RepID=A0A1F6NY42_9BACT|nr:MAG: phosphoglycerate mutase (2,3-diphosphoglycerate-independent) [Candidatus Magasanikbacteria bacterium RIFOXYC2_FULL_42_28]